MKSHYSVQFFSDANEHGRSLANLVQNYFQIEKGRFHSTLRQIELDGIHAFNERANCDIVQCGAVLPSAVALAWTVPALASGASDRTHGGRMHSGLKRGGGDWMYRVAADMEVAGFTMPAVEFDRLVEPLGFPATRSASRHIRFMHDSHAFSVLRSGFDELKNHVEHLDREEVRAVLRKQLLDGIFCALQEAEVAGRPNLTRQTYNDIVKRSQDLVLGNPEYPPSVLDVCTELRVCRRTLQTSFTRVMGMSPSSYLRKIRLGGVRRLLRSVPASQMTIGEAAARWGFFHLGSFSNDYRQFFCELPSQTLRFGAGH
ncbi:helix-turn-helix domain-containing protein [Massilia cavernae]|uniref:helix-turn-helix domain-containing protein n=1 Tax=Massilia cavernae TaxID=2320864 RepID=UPI0016003696|nr:helix-turn-helix domain-containing protein [Massilia cavernae]